MTAAQPAAAGRAAGVQPATAQPAIAAGTAASTANGCGGCPHCGGGAACGNTVARAAAFANRANLNAIDYVEVSDDQLTVLVHFMGAVPAVAGPAVAGPAVAGGGQPEGLTAGNVRITGGEAVTGIAVTGLAVLRPGDEDAPGDDSDDGDESGSALAVTVDRRGDFSTYTISLGTTPGGGPGSSPTAGTATPDGHGSPTAGDGWEPLPDFDPAFSSACFSFKAGCPTGVDCVQKCPAPSVATPDPSIDYLAKDYESFRSLMLDRLAATMPAWQERHAADVGIAVVEALAYAADELSYYQDAVATEAYLRTARQRISVRRHVRLVDYYLHEGLNARAWLTVWTDRDTPPIDAADMYFITGFPALTATAGTVLTHEQLSRLPAGDVRVFEPVDSAAKALVFHAARNEIDFYTAGEAECRLPRGTTAATLVDRALWRRANPEAPLPGSWHGTVPAQPLNLAPGDVLVLEEILGPATGNPADARADHRQAVRLTAATVPPEGGWLVRVAWDAADALAFDLCLATRTAAPDCRRVERIGVARGNVILVDHGRTVTDPPWDPVPVDTVIGECTCDGAAVEETTVPERIAPTLAQLPVTHTDALLPGPASAALARDARMALPAVEISFTDPATGTSTRWEPQRTLLESSPLDRAFVVEIDDAGRARLRFGDGNLGEQPAAGLTGTARYRVGNGTAGNVGRDSISFLVLRNQSWSGVAVRPRNPLPATGGVDGEPVAEARLLAPDEFRRTRLRAVTAGDYAALAGRAPELQRAAAHLAWTGSWYEARVVVDPWGSERPSAQLLTATAAGLAPYRRMGHDLAVTAAAYVPIEVEVEVCVLPHYVRGDVRAQLLHVLGRGSEGSGSEGSGSGQIGAGGQGGFFSPDRLTFGTGVYVSALVAAAQAVPGVESAVVSRLQRQGEPANHELENGILAVGPLEIVRLENSPNFPDRGKLTLILGGGL